jgi:hypothetical protein
MIAPPRPPTHDELEALIKEARARQRQRRLLGAAGVAVAALGLSLYASHSGGSAEVAQPPAGAGNPGVPFCRSSQLSGSLFLQGAVPLGLAGGVTILNTGRIACALPSARPHFWISFHGKQLPMRQEAGEGPTGFSTVRILAPRTKASVYWEWYSCAGPGVTSAVNPTFQLRFGHGLVVAARSSHVTLAFCGRRTFAVSPSLKP